MIANDTNQDRDRLKDKKARLRQRRIGNDRKK